MTRRRRRVGALAAAGLACLCVATTLPARADTATQLQGEGESWPQPMLEQLQNTSANVIKPFQPGYVDVGDEQARTDLAEGGIDFASVGAPFSADQLADAKRHGRAIAYVPYAFGAVAIAFSVDISNPDGARVPSMNATASTLTKLFTHFITTWTDAELAAENQPDLGLSLTKSQSVFDVTRLDSSSSTASLISYFLSNPDARTTWDLYANALKAAPDTALDRWPIDSFSSNVGIISGSKGVVDTMLALNPATGIKVPNSVTHHIAYLAPAWTHGAPLVSVQNAAGKFVGPTAAGVEKTVETAATVDPKTNIVTFDWSKMTDPAAYPIPMVEYLAVPTTGISAAKAKALSKFVKYVLSDAGQKVVADSGYVPVSTQLRASGLKVAAALAATTTVQGGPTTTTTKKSGATTTTTSDVTGTTTDTTPTSGASVDPGVVSGGDGGSGSSGLPFTGGPSPMVVVGAVVILFAAAIGRRHARRARA